MRIAYLDCVGGVSGDMFVGALLDAGWPEEAWRRGVSWLASEIAELRVEERRHHSFRGLGIVVHPREADAHAGADAHHGAGGGHRTLTEVVALLEGASLPPPVLARARRVFERLAEAEGRAHGRAPHEVRFHEVGAVDAIVDVVSTCLGLSDLGIAQLYVSSLPVGGGSTESAHGRIPLPAPAAAFLLEGWPVRWVSGLGERCTPTGVALVTTLAEQGLAPEMRVERVGCGAGSLPLAELPNIARLFVGERIPVGAEPDGAARCVAVDGAAIPSWGWDAEEPGRAPDAGCPGRWRPLIVLAAEIDDATPEELSDLAERLRDAGCLDVCLHAVGMKKGRQGAALQVLGLPEQAAPLAALILRHSPTLGVRWRREWRRELLRREIEVGTPFGPIRVKLAWRGDAWVGKPEHESCRQAALASGVALRLVRDAAVRSLGSLPPGGAPFGIGRPDGPGAAESRG